MADGHSHEFHSGKFRATIDRLNPEGELIRIRVQFKNAKYLSQSDVLNFWHQSHHESRCRGIVLAADNDLVLLKVPDYKFCESRVALNLGAHLEFSSDDFARNTTRGREVELILKERYKALTSLYERLTAQLQADQEKLKATERRYGVLDEKLLAEWRQELSHLEERRALILKSSQEILSELDRIDKKIEDYRLEDENLIIDRWALSSGARKSVPEYQKVTQIDPPQKVRNENKRIQNHLFLGIGVSQVGYDHTNKANPVSISSSKVGPLRPSITLAHSRPDQNWQLINRFEYSLVNNYSTEQDIVRNPKEYHYDLKTRFYRSDKSIFAELGYSWSRFSVLNYEEITQERELRPYENTLHSLVTGIGHQSEVFARKFEMLAGVKWGLSGSARGEELASLKGNRYFLSLRFYSSDLRWSYGAEVGRLSLKGQNNIVKETGGVLDLRYQLF